MMLDVFCVGIGFQDRESIYPVPVASPRSLILSQTVLDAKQRSCFKSTSHLDTFLPCCKLDVVESWLLLATDPWRFSWESIACSTPFTSWQSLSQIINIRKTLKLSTFTFYSRRIHLTDRHRSGLHRTRELQGFLYPTASKEIVDIEMWVRLYLLRIMILMTHYYAIPFWACSYAFASCSNSSLNR